MSVNLAAHRFKIIPEASITEDERNLWVALFRTLTPRDFNVLYTLYFSDRESEIYTNGYNIGEQETLKRLVMMEQEMKVLQVENEALMSNIRQPSPKRPYITERDNDDDNNQTHFR